jgi:hypothetical protein
MNKTFCDAPEVVDKALNRDRKHKQTFVTFDTLADIGKYCEKNHNSTSFYGWERESDSWYGGFSAKKVVNTLSTGDEKFCAGYEKLMSKFEDMDLSTMRAGWRNDVAGQRPDVQSYLAGHPLSMRRRVREDNSNSPMAIIVDVTLSAVCDENDMQKRGAAILALLRLLTARRPVELWLTSVMDSNVYDWGCVLVRIETTPLDIATSSFVFGSLGFTRMICYGIGEQEFNFAGRWGFNSGNVSRKHMKELYRPKFEHVEEMLCIPGMNSKDKLVTNPDKWIHEQLKRFAPGFMGDDIDF